MRLDFAADKSNQKSAAMGSLEHQSPTRVKSPYLIFLGEVSDPKLAKTAFGAVDWAREQCIGQLRLSKNAVDLGLPDMTVTEAAAAGAQTLVIGIANPGGTWAESWQSVFKAALTSKLDIASGLHQRLNSDPVLAQMAGEFECSLIELREPPSGLSVASGQPRSGRRLLTVGTDCAVGKKYTALAIWRALLDEGVNADFCATGQTGVLISGRGFAIDAVISDFIAGAAELLSPANSADHWDIIEGQGSLFHPAYAGVSLGLLHGAQPEAIVLCHEAGRNEIAFFSGYDVPDIDLAIARNLEAARLTSPDAYCAGISINTASLAEDAALQLLEATQNKHGLPVVDPIRTGVEPIVRRIR